MLMRLFILVLMLSFFGCGGRSASLILKGDELYFNESYDEAFNHYDKASKDLKIRIQSREQAIEYARVISKAALASFHSSKNENYLPYIFSSQEDILGYIGISCLKYYKDICIKPSEYGNEFSVIYSILADSSFLKKSNAGYKDCIIYAAAGIEIALSKRQNLLKIFMKCSDKYLAKSPQKLAALNNYIRELSIAESNIPKELEPLSSIEILIDRTKYYLKFGFSKEATKQILHAKNLYSQEKYIALKSYADAKQSALAYTMLANLSDSTHVNSKSSAQSNVLTLVSSVRQILSNSIIESEQAMMNKNLRKYHKLNKLDISEYIQLEL